MTFSFEQLEAYRLGTRGGLSNKAVAERLGCSIADAGKWKAAVSQAVNPSYADYDELQVLLWGARQVVNMPITKTGVRVKPPRVVETERDKKTKPITKRKRKRLEQAAAIVEYNNRVPEESRKAVIDLLLHRSGESSAKVTKVRAKRERRLAKANAKTPIEPPQIYDSTKIPLPGDFDEPTEPPHWREDGSNTDPYSRW